MHCYDTGCVATINDSTLIYSGGSVAGGFEGALWSYLYDVERDTWTQMIDLSDDRYYHGCGSIDAQVGLKKALQNTHFVINVSLTHHLGRFRKQRSVGCR